MLDRCPIWTSYIRIWQNFLLGEDKGRIYYERAYLSTPGFVHSPRGNFMVELFKFLQNDTSVGTGGRKSDQLSPNFKNAIRW